MDAERVESHLNIPAKDAAPRSLVLRDWPRMLVGLLLTTGLTAAGMLWLDQPLARWLFLALDQGPTRQLVQGEYPDLLNVFVAVVTVGSWAGYIILRHARLHNRLVCLLQVIGTAVPFSYTAKDVLKALFGRVNTRYWLDHPYHYEFHWLNGGDPFFGFPSGHLAVAAAILFAVMHYYPRLRAAGWFLIAAFGLALIASEYHFLSDVVAGTYIGYLAFVAARELPGTTPSAVYPRQRATAAANGTREAG